MIPQNTFPAGDADMPAGQDARILFDIKPWHGGMIFLPQFDRQGGTDE
jgi:hypothetical protein